MVRVLLPNRARISVTSYKDYCDGSDVCVHVPLTAKPAATVDFANGLRARGGGDSPEATKTGLNRIADEIRKHGANRQSIVIHYTDAPPHCELSDSDRGNKRGEQERLNGKEPGYDWVHICRWFARMNVPVYTFLTARSSQ